MKNLQQATERICELKGAQVAQDAFLSALLAQQAPSVRAALGEAFELHAEVARTVLLHTAVSDLMVSAFERDVARLDRLIRMPGTEAPAAA
jgi:iron only hydrogenase large subunit-like protein